jgi:hypothetical protein
MVRKLLYISEEHERSLKARARDHGVWEAKLVRRMLDGILLGGEGGRGSSARMPRRPWRASSSGPSARRRRTASPEATRSTGTRSVKTAPDTSARVLL